MPELLPAVGAVQLSGLVQVGVAPLQAGQVDDHVIAHVLPHAEQDDGQHGGLFAGGPAGQVLNAQRRQDRVDRAHGGVENHVPHGGHRDQRRHVGEERHRTEEVAQTDVLVQQHGHGQAAHQRQGHRTDDVDDGVDQRRLEDAVGGEQFDEILQRHKLDVVAAVP